MAMPSGPQPTSAVDPQGDQPLHDPARGTAAAFEALARVGPGAFVRCMHPMGNSAPAPPALLARLPDTVRLVPLDSLTLSLVGPEGHVAVHAAWLDAAGGPDRVGHSLVPSTGPLRSAAGEVVDTSYLDVHIFDFIGVDGIDLLVATLEPTDPPSGDQAHDAARAAFRIHMDERGRIVETTENTAGILGLDPAELLGMEGLRLIHPDDQPQSLVDWLAVLAAPDQPRPGRVRLRRGDGTWGWFEVVNWNGLGDPTIRAVVAELHDVDEQVRAETVGVASSRAHERLVRVLDEVDDIVLVGRLEVGLVYWNRAAETKLPGIRAGVPLTRLMGPMLRQIAESDVKPTLRRLERWSGDLEITLLDGAVRIMATTVTPVLDATQDDVFYGVILRDVTAERRHALELAAQARRDPLTSLPNRLALSELLQSLDGDDVSLCFIDLDNLKVVNDGLGHGAGDKLLVSVTEALLAVAGAGTVTRFGGDEFVVVHTDLGGIDQASELAQVLLAAIEDVRVPDVPTRLSASIGVAWTRIDDLDPEDLIKDADTAMYDAKRRGRGRVARFDHDQREAVTRRFVMETALQRAIADDEIDVLLQPVLSVPDGTIAGFEALARWGLVSPTELVATAEASGLIVPLGARVLDRSLSYLSRLDQHLRSLTPPGSTPPIPMTRIAVNVSGRELVEPTFPERTLATLADHAIAPSRLVLELTESVLIDTSDVVDRSLRVLRDAGVSLVLDDFGTGYSSIAYLRRYPIDGLKLDNSYTRALLSHTDTRVIAETIIGLAHRLGLTIVAEGVEEEAQLDALRELGITWVQGFLLSPALPIDDILLGALGDLGTKLRQVPG